MANTMIRPLRSEADYEAALDAIERYFDHEPARARRRPTASIFSRW